MEYEVRDMARPVRNIPIVILKNSPQGEKNESTIRVKK